MENMRLDKEYHHLKRQMDKITGKILDVAINALSLPKNADSAYSAFKSAFEAEIPDQKAD